MSIHTMEYYLALEKKEILTQATTWMDFEDIVLSEISQSQKRQILDNSTIYEKPAAAAARSLQSCPTLCNPTRLPCPWDSPGKNTGVGCHFLLQ